MTQKIKGLIDGDILVYQLASAVEESIHWGNDWWTLTADNKLAKDMMDESIQSLVRESSKGSLEVEDFVIVLTASGDNWRKDIFPEYKAHRKDTRKPIVWHPLREHLCDKHSAIKSWANLEADDVIGILAEPDTIVISTDKDFKSIPCILYNPNEGTTSEIKEHQADYWHMYQTLTGDSADGYKGCPGLGAVRTRRLLLPWAEQDPLDSVEVWETVVEAFEGAGLSEDEALVQARVSRILRSHEEYNSETGAVKLWIP